MATNPKKGAKQTKKQSACVSPRSGASPRNPKSFKPGQSGNPAGGSAKQRFKSALEKMLKARDCETLVTTILDVGTDKDHAHAAQAWGFFAKVLGLTTDEEKREVIVKTEIALEDRRGSPDQPAIMVRSVSSRSHNQARTGDGAEGVEIEV